MLSKFQTIIINKRFWKFEFCTTILDHLTSFDTFQAFSYFRPFLINFDPFFKSNLDVLGDTLELLASHPELLCLMSKSHILITRKIKYVSLGLPHTIGNIILHKPWNMASNKRIITGKTNTVNGHNYIQDGFQTEWKLTYKHSYIPFQWVQ
jgi:hypothetical protein